MITDHSTKTKGKPDHFQQSAPAINLPKGGGAIRGMSEKIAANAAEPAGWPFPSLDPNRSY